MRFENGVELGCFIGFASEAVLAAMAVSYVLGDILPVLGDSAVLPVPP